MEIKPCPVCGQQPKLFDKLDNSQHPPRMTYYYCCVECRSTNSIAVEPSQNLAVVAWNSYVEGWNPEKLQCEGALLQNGAGI